MKAKNPTDIPERPIYQMPQSYKDNPNLMGVLREKLEAKEGKPVNYSKEVLAVDPIGDYYILCYNFISRKWEEPSGEKFEEDFRWAEINNLKYE